MPGQPLANLRLRGDYGFSDHRITDAPSELMALVARSIAHWSLAQAHLGNAFAELVGAKSGATVSMYASFDNFQVQRVMLLTAAKELLPKRYSDTFSATLTVIERAAKERHRFAHWVCGAFSNSAHRDILLLADPKDMWRVRSAAVRHFRKFKVWEHGDATQPDLDPRKILAYRESDLKGILEQIERAEYYAYALSFLARSKPRVRLPVLRLLLDQPDIRSAYDTARQKETKSKKAPQKPPRVSKRARREAALVRRRAAEGDRAGS